MPIDLKTLAKPGVLKLQPYQPGKPVEELERELGIHGAVKLASNESPLPQSDAVKQAVITELETGSRYPDGNGFYLKRLLAEKLSIDAGQITLGNGSNDVLELIARAFLGPQHNAIMSQHGFIIYSLVVTEQEAELRVTPANDWGHDLDAMANSADANTRVMFIANPNNPTGTWVGSQAIKSLLEKVPETVIVVVDEAYYEYVDKPEYNSAIHLLDEHQNLVVTRTFSKAYGLASLRIGYGISHPAIADLLNRLRQPFNVNSFALAAAQAALGDTAYLQQSINVNREGYKQLTAGFEELGLHYIPSAGNFIAVEIPNASIVYEGLLERGVIVRPIGVYEMPNHLRISIGLPEENTLCLSALRDILSATVKGDTK